MDLIGQYIRYKMQLHLRGAIIMNNFSLICMTTFNPDMGWFEIVKVPGFELDEVMETRASSLGLISGILHRLRSLG